MKIKYFFKPLSIILLSALFNDVYAQPAWTIDLLGKEKKPEQFKERKLGSERMADKKFTLYRRVVQNTFTHYNYYYNANNKINAVIERAKASQKDNYTKLLSYYPYSLENTAMQKQELDSVIYKATAGILLHDLRNDWIDNLYLLMGKAYYLRKDFDSAAATFQFINYNLFPRKKNEDYDKVIGTNDDGSRSRISIANKEKQNILQKLTAQPPSRNDALVWLARTLTEQNEVGEAAGLIHTLLDDPNLPQRLIDNVNEVRGYWFYKQEMYDSAAAYLEKALSNADNKLDLSRSEFLLGQMYEMTGQFEKASEFYNKASLHTTDPLIDIYAQLNNAKMRKGNNLKELDLGIANLIKLTKKDKFEAYRDILFYSAGELALEKPDSSQAIIFYTKSYELNENNISYKNQAFIKLADIAYDRKNYKIAYNYYDSLQSGDTTLENLDQIQQRRNSLSKIVEKIYIIEKEDSLQKIASMEPAKREAFVKKLSRKLRKERGLKEEDNSSGATDLISFDSKKDAPVDLFQSSGKSGEWYFYNASTKSKGFSDFKRKWGNRTNTDNWRRKDAMAAATVTQNNMMDNVNMNPDEAAPQKDDNGTQGGKGNIGGASPAANQQPEDISYDGMMANLPLTPEKITESNNKIAVATYDLGKLFQSELEDYEIAINTYDQSLQRFPDSLYDGDIYANLYFCYFKLGDKQKAAYYKDLLNKKFAGSAAAKLLNNPIDSKKNKTNPAATQQYEGIYNLFIEGKFEDALSQKHIADSLYGNNFWSPQLLYIEAVYHIKQRNDQDAVNVLNNIINLYPTSKLKTKAETMIEVLGRRKEIEDYLTKLEVTRAKEDEIIQATPAKQRLVRNDSNLIVSPKLYDSSKTVVIKNDKLLAKDSLVKAPAKPVLGAYSFNAAAIHNVIMILDKVDPTYVNESKNAFTRFAADNYRQSKLTLKKDTLDANRSYILFENFANAEEALQFFIKIKKAAPEEVSWLPANKYSFYIIDNDNLQRLIGTKDIIGYKNLLEKIYPGTFK